MEALALHQAPVPMKQQINSGGVKDLHLKTCDTETTGTLGQCLYNLRANMPSANPTPSGSPGHLVLAAHTHRLASSREALFTQTASRPGSSM